MRSTLPCGPGSVIVAVPHRLGRVLIRGVLLISIVFAIKFAVPIAAAVALWVQAPAGRGALRVEWDGQAGGAVGWWMLGLLFLLFVVLIGAVVVCSRVPEFAVCVEGIKVPMGMANRGTRTWSMWNPGTWGFFPWEDVDRCHWGRYQPEKLMIHLKSIERPVVVLWGEAQRQMFPAMVHEYRVTEVYRERVEEAIRAFGNWEE